MSKYETTAVPWRRMNIRKELFTLRAGGISRLRKRDGVVEHAGGSFLTMRHLMKLRHTIPFRSKTYGGLRYGGVAQLSSVSPVLGTYGPFWSS